MWPKKQTLHNVSDDCRRTVHATSYRSRGSLIVHIQAGTGKTGQRSLRPERQTFVSSIVHEAFDLSEGGTSRQSANG